MAKLTFEDMLEYLQDIRTCAIEGRHADLFVELDTLENTLIELGTDMPNFMTAAGIAQLGILIGTTKERLQYSNPDIEVLTVLHHFSEGDLTTQVFNWHNLTEKEQEKLDNF